MDKGNGRDNKWTKSIAVGSKEFVDDVKRELGGHAKGRKARETGESYQLSEPSATYSSHFEVEKAFLAPKKIIRLKRIRKPQRQEWKK